MDRYRAAGGRPPVRGRETSVLDAIDDCRFLAAGKLAVDDARARAAEAALPRSLAEAGAGAVRPPRLGGARRRLGAALARIGGRLRGAGPTEVAVRPAGPGGGRAG